MSIILASQSPRRRELLAQMGVPQFEVVPALGEVEATGVKTAELLVVVNGRQEAEEEEDSNLSSFFLKKRT